MLPYTLGVILAWGLYRGLAAPGATFAAFALFMGTAFGGRQVAVQGASPTGGRGM